MQFFLFLALILALMLMVFSFQNPDVIPLKFVKWEYQGSLTLILVVSFAAGMLAGIFSLIPPWWRKAKTSRLQKKRIQELERELLDITEHRSRSEGEEIGEEEEF
ncbi:LapA family protein [bacterium]|nr:MAG: LapA family protein [bacterium]